MKAQSTLAAALAMAGAAFSAVAQAVPLQRHEPGAKVRRSRRQKAKAHIDNNGTPHSFSGAKLIRRAMKGTVGRAVLR